MMPFRPILRVFLRLSFSLGLVVAAATPAWPAPFAFDTAFGRLPKNIVPLDYTIAVVPDAAARTLAGSERIVLNVRTATSTVVFNTLNESLTAVRFDDAPVARVETDNNAQITTLTLARAAAPGTHRLTFDYTGRIETAPQGLFAQPYRTSEGTDGLMLSTQFEATDARRMFPCWDEPAFRATYGLSVTVPAAWTTVSNMPVASRTVHGTLATTTFTRTPKMPSYLLEFSAGDLASIGARDGTTDFGVVAVRGHEREGAVALANAQQILADYNAYFGYAYPLPKLDSIAVPGGFEGAMENWGAITYNDQALLLNGSSTLANRQNVFSIQAHEMAHQWNGDLVTMGWWDDLWLNESFASWMAAKETALRNPSWNWWQDQDADKELAMAADARTTSHAIQVHIADELQAENAFDPEITYAKGQAFLRMLEAYLGEDTFRSGIRRYMHARAFSNATGTDLWNALSAAGGRDVAALAQAWTEQPGFPLVTVHATCDQAGTRTIALTQTRFLLEGSDRKSARWTVPLAIRTAPGAALQRVLLERDGQTAAAGSCADPLAVNADAIGFYRVAYDDATLAANRAHLTALSDGDRIAMLDDQWALVRAGKATLPTYLGLVSALGANENPRTWDQVATALGAIERYERGTPGYAHFTAYARSVLKPIATRLGWAAQADETPDRQTLRRTLLADLGEWGDRETIAEAKSRFDRFAADRSTLAPDDQGVVMHIVAAQADADTFERLHAVAKSAKNETEIRRYYAALTAVRDPKLAARTLAIVMSPEIPPQAETLRYEFVMSLADAHPQLSWQFFKDNYDTLVRPFGPLQVAEIAKHVPEEYWRAAPLADIRSFVRAKVPLGMAPEIANGMERAAFEVSEEKTIVPATDMYVGSMHLINRGR